MWGNGTFSPTLTELPNASLRVVQVALGSSHVAVRVQSGDLYTWGSNLYVTHFLLFFLPSSFFSSNSTYRVGQLGLGTTVDSVAQPCKVPNLPPLVGILFLFHALKILLINYVDINGDVKASYLHSLALTTNKELYLNLNLLFGVAG